MNGEKKQQELEKGTNYTELVAHRRTRGSDDSVSVLLLAKRQSTQRFRAKQKENDVINENKNTATGHKKEGMAAAVFFLIIIISLCVSLLKKRRDTTRTRNVQLVPC